MKEMSKRGLFLLLFAILFITLLAGNVPAAFSQSPEPRLKMVFEDRIYTELKRELRIIFLPSDATSSSPGQPVFVASERC